MIPVSYKNWAVDTSGNVIGGATVTVYDADGTTLATIYSDVDRTPLANPLTASAGGAFEFLAEMGTYFIRVGSTSSNATLYENLVSLDAITDAVDQSAASAAAAAVSATEAEDARDVADTYAGIDVRENTWAALNAITGTTGQSAYVPSSDTGTHTDPVVGGTANNAGVFDWSDAPAGWERVGDNGIAYEAEDRKAEDTKIFGQSLWHFYGDLADDDGLMPSVVGGDDVVLTYAETTITPEQQFEDALWQFYGDNETDNDAPSVVGYDNRIIELWGADLSLVSLFEASLWDFYGDTDDPDRAPSLVGGDNRILTVPTMANMPDFQTYILNGELRAVGGSSGDRSVNDDDGRIWLSQQVSDQSIRGVSEANGERTFSVVSPDTGDMYRAGSTVVFLSVGQSNSRGSQSGAPEIELLRSTYPFPDNLVMLGDDVWVGLPSDSTIVFDPNDVSGWNRLTGTVSGNYSNTAGETAAYTYAQKASDDCGRWVPYVAAINVAVGGQSIEELGPEPPSGETCWSNLVAIMTRAEDLKEDNRRLLVPWLLMSQGESNTGTATLGADHDAYRANIEAQAASLWGQDEPVRMISWQMSSFLSQNDGVKSILSHYQDNRSERGNFWCAGPSYAFPYADSWLHLTALGHVMRGEFDAEIVRRIERTGYWDPLTMVSGTVTGANEITVTLSHDAEIATDDYVASITGAGIQLVGATISGVSVSGTSLIITTSDAASGATRIKAGLDGQTSPRTEAEIPRTNIRGTEVLGSYKILEDLGSPMDMQRWMCHHEITIS